ncbi:MAG: DNA-binding response regulator [Betaproteobacteria bacterium RIFCSPLOWO2_02_FULL_63_19]|nr:MAG: DNA-binding response regulator [Betaproteobacteria bacterium RIFCSPLOWO2_02_FULL_63_19]
MDGQGQILIVDDDAEIRSLLAEYLTQHGYKVTTARDGVEMRQALEAAQPDLVVLDLMLPGEDGLSLCRDLRARSTLPVIMLTARREEIDRIIGIEMGADDYLGKPFNPRELLARIKSVLRRARALPASRGNAKRLRFAGWTLDCTARHLVDPQGVVVPLSGVQFRLLSVFLSHPDRVLDRDRLVDLTLGREATPFDRSIDVQVSRLRQLLHDNGREPRIIKTVRNGGYVLATTVERLDA